MNITDLVNRGSLHQESMSELLNELNEQNEYKEYLRIKKYMFLIIGVIQILSKMLNLLKQEQRLMNI